jgi:hypothetical protein
MARKSRPSSRANSPRCMRALLATTSGIGKPPNLIMIVGDVRLFFDAFIVGIVVTIRLAILSKLFILKFFMARRFFRVRAYLKSSLSI